MASSTPRTPEQFRAPDPQVGDFHVNELASDKPGAMSPYGTELEFPLALDKIRYTHPSAADRPHLADGR